MIRYHPLESCAPWSDSDSADLRLFDWQTGTAEFSMIDDDRVVAVSFDSDVIVRMLDEFPLSTEDKPGNRMGIVPHHFAYRVEGDPFFKAQSEAWRDVQGSPQHYRFLTGAGCLDVISTAVPRFALLARERP
ncbi:hypothetical protein M2338_002934 [Sphingobium sp. B2D3B]|uniref:hypothetical protein n=1 Tax=Sphingobium sp. B2D3B TaxID=2940580 RepID=UPI002225965F|nr:hypothetical protein [Sphingobium sp. B2D3B]MCW2383369.1 hypothetical protein [Sphingobium sp. B2D3B]